MSVVTDLNHNYLQATYTALTHRQVTAVSLLTGYQDQAVLHFLPTTQFCTYPTWETNMAEPRSTPLISYTPHPPPTILDL